ncbi:MAG: ABC transporter substrate-binding protein [Bacteroidales bacterium]|nr:ABC transporter substrate-binding protein [Bacteroidales bacterium]
MRLSRVLFLTFLLILALPSGVAGQEADKPFVFSPQWMAQAQFAGYYAALEKGFYDEEGVKVEIVHPFATQDLRERLASVKADAVTLPLTEAMKMVAGGYPLVNILQTSMNTALAIVSRNGQDPTSLGKAKVSTWRSGYDQLVRCMASDMGSRFQWIEAANPVSLFVAAAVDATVTMTYNELLLIQQAGFNIAGAGVFKLKDHDLNIQEEGVYMSRSHYLSNKDRADRFARASRRGWEWVAEHQDEALDIVMKYVKEYRIPTNRVVQKLMLQEVLSLQLDSGSGQRAFVLRPDMVDKANKILVGGGMLSREVKVEELLP